MAFRFSSSLILAALGLVMGTTLAVAESPPNVLFLLCDDLGYGDLHCYGHPSIQTPNLDQLADDGMRLTACYSASPICSPARAGLLTGRCPTRSGIYSWISEGNPMFLRRDETTIATLLKQAGYDTCHVGKWHLNGHFNSPEQTQPNDHGFAHWFSTHNNAAPSHENPTNFVRDGQPVGPQTGFSCQLIVDEAIRWLQARPDAARPFFLHVCFHEPHEPIASPADLVGQYPQAKGKGEALYYANVSNMDRAVGRLLAMLKGLKLEENTLVCFTSDNGPEGLNRYPNAWRSWGTAGPLRGRKLYVYEGGVRVPGIVRWPGKIAPRQVRDEPVGSVDLLPTVCELAKIAPPTGQPLDGTSLVPLLLGKTWERRQPLFWHYLGGVDNRQAALRDGDWKIVGAWDQNPKMPAGATLRPGDVPMMKQSRLVGFELYNVARDPAEKEDLSTAEPRRLAELSQALQSRYAEILAQGPYWFEDQPANRNLTK